MTKPSWLLAAVAVCAIVTGCQPAPDSAQTAATSRPQQAGQPIAAAVIASFIAAADVAAFAGDRALRAQLQAMQREQLREMRIADPYCQLEEGEQALGQPTRQVEARWIRS